MNVKRRFFAYGSGGHAKVNSLLASFCVDSLPYLPEYVNWTALKFYPWVSVTFCNSLALV